MANTPWVKTIYNVDGQNSTYIGSRSSPARIWTYPDDMRLALRCRAPAPSYCAPQGYKQPQGDIAWPFLFFFLRSLFNHFFSPTLLGVPIRKNNEREKLDYDAVIQTQKNLRLETAQSDEKGSRSCPLIDGPRLLDNNFTILLKVSRGLLMPGVIAQWQTRPCQSPVAQIWRCTSRRICNLHNLDSGLIDVAFITSYKIV